MIKPTVTVFKLSVVASSLLVTTAAHAACHWEGPLIGGHLVCDEGGLLGPATGPGIDYFTIHVKNDCKYRIQVAMRHKTMVCADYPSTGASCTAEFVSEDKKWIGEGWWTLEPGGEAYIGDSLNSILYLYAESLPHATLRWAGDHSFDVRGRTVQGFEVNMGSSFTNYTHRFVCP